MINAIIFDFGDIFINLEKEKSIEEFKKLGLNGPNEELIAKNDLFEKGQITELQFCLRPNSELWRTNLYYYFSSFHDFYGY